MAAPAAAAAAVSPGSLAGLARLLQAAGAAGFSSNEIQSLISSVTPPVTPEVTSAPPGTNRQLIGSVLSGVGGLGSGFGIGSLLQGPRVDVDRPVSKYFIDPGFLLESQRYTADEAFKRQVLEFLTLGTYQAPFELESPAALQTRIEEMRQREANALNEREIAKLQAQGEVNKAIQNIITAGTVETERQRGLSNVQQQRVASSYTLAQDLLNRTVDNLMRVPSSSAAANLANVPTIS